MHYFVSFNFLIIITKIECWPVFKQDPIISVAEEYEGDWKSAVITNGVSIGAAYAWIRGSEMEAKKRGGVKRIKVTEQHVGIC